MYKKVTKSFSYQFKSSKGGLYSITIDASCKSGRILGLFGGEDLRVEIDGLKLREMPAKSRPQYFNIPSSWNGTKLKGIPKTVIFILELTKGEHAIKFIPKRGAIIKKEPEINLIKNTKNIQLDLNQEAEDGNRRPWITLALINLPLKTLDASVTCEKRKQDSDDVKLIINGKIQKNNQASWWGKNWYWQGRQLKGDAKEARFTPDLPSGIHYIELWADRMPVLNEVRMDLGVKKEEKREKKVIQKYTYKGVNGREDYNRFDTEIEKAVNHWNKEFQKGKNPVKELLDPNLVKAMIYQESKMGYYPGGEIDVMQVGHPDNPALRTLNGELEEWEMKEGGLWRINYAGKANVDIPEKSIYWGVRWLYHKAQGIKDNKRYWRSWKDAVFEYGPNTQKYVNEVWKIYKKGIDKYKEKTIQLWSIILIPMLLGLIFLWLHLNQGQVYFKYKDIGEEYTYIGRLWLEIRILDGFRIKKATIGPIESEEFSDIGLMRDRIMVDYYDFDNDGKDDVLISARHSTGNEVRYFFRIGKKNLEKINFVNYSNPYTGDNSFYAENIIFGPKDELDRYTFIEEHILRYSNAPHQIWRTYYRFNNEGNIVFNRVEKEDIILY